MQLVFLYFHGDIDYKIEEESPLVRYRFVLESPDLRSTEPRCIQGGLPVLQLWRTLIYLPESLEHSRESLPEPALLHLRYFSFLREASVLARNSFLSLRWGRTSPAS